jgi:mono/diheme cytochrome c family protein
MRTMLLVCLLAIPAFADQPPPSAVRMFKAKCGSCHGADGKGQTDQGRKLGIADLSSPAWQAAHSDAQLTEILSTNKAVKSHGAETPHFQTKLKATEVSGVIAVLRSFK